MPRKRRSPEQAKREILHAAQQLLLEEGPESLKLSRIAKRAKLSHPLVLHHFGSTDQLLFHVQESIARDIRNQLLHSLKEAPVQQGFFHVLETLSSEKTAKLMAWLIARGHSPFPPTEERGLQQIQAALHQRTGRPQKELAHIILLVLFASYGEGMFGAELRARLGIADNDDSKEEFRTWLFSLLG